MTEDEKKVVKRSNRYCFFTSPCSIYEPKPMYLLSSYVCCSQCKKRATCKDRCSSDYVDCRLATTKEQLLSLSDTIKEREEDVVLFPGAESNSPTSNASHHYSLTNLKRR